VCRDPGVVKVSKVCRYRHVVEVSEVTHPPVCGGGGIPRGGGLPRGAPIRGAAGRGVPSGGARAA